MNIYSYERDEITGELDGMRLTESLHRREWRQPVVKGEERERKLEGELYAARKEAKNDKEEAETWKGEKAE